ncbi:MAG TPA: hypothetical protein VIC24_01635 [Gemmatimonadaceae bacterium]
MHAAPVDTQGERRQTSVMPLLLSFDAPTMLIRKTSFERAGLVRSAIDERFALTPDEFRVEVDIVAIGPLHADDAIVSLTEYLESVGLVYFDDFVEMSGNWPAWLGVSVSGRPTTAR